MVDDKLACGTCQQSVLDELESHWFEDRERYEQSVAECWIRLRRAGLPGTTWKKRNVGFRKPLLSRYRQAVYEDVRGWVVKECDPSNSYDNYDTDGGFVTTAGEWCGFGSNDVLKSTSGSWHLDKLQMLNGLLARHGIPEVAVPRRHIPSMRPLRDLER